MQHDDRIAGANDEISGLTAGHELRRRAVAMHRAAVAMVALAARAIAARIACWSTARAPVLRLPAHDRKACRPCAPADRCDRQCMLPQVQATGEHGRCASRGFSETPV